jgi:hypothetical protein
MSDPNIKVLAAIECLKDIGFTREQVNERIAGWIQKAGAAGQWRDLPPDTQSRLGQAMQKYFEFEFKQRSQAA